MVEELNKSNISTDVLCFNDKSKNSFEEKNYKIFRASSLFTLKSTPFSISLLQILYKIHKDYSIIHLHLPNPTGAIALQLVNYKGKIVIHWHSDIIKQKTLKKFYAPFQKALLKRADRIIVTSPPYLEGSNDLKEFKSKCVIIPIGINNPRPCDQNHLDNLKSDYENKKIVFSIGRLIYYKGFNYLIEAAKELPDNCIVLIGGTGELARKLMGIIKNYHLESKVKLLGKIPENEISSYFELCDLYCLPSCERSEAFGIVQIEAMSFSKPIISTKIPYSGVSWINDDGVTGLVVPPKNASSLAQAIISILTNQELSKEMGINARKKFESEFTIKKMNQRIIDLYNSL
jgi:rhamnosyl/mannosyltransferase